jgi:hypothetical protein
MVMDAVSRGMPGWPVLTMGAARASALGLPAVLLVHLFSPAAMASDHSDVCTSAGGRYEITEGVLTRTGGQSGEDGIPYRRISQKTIRRETGYCLADKGGAQKFNFESHSYTLRAAFKDEGTDIELDFICEFVSDGLPAAYSCTKKVMTTPDGGAGGEKPVERARAEALAPPLQDGSSIWMHNDSVMRLEADGAMRRFYYVRPRDGMLKVGARPDSLLFEGRREGRRIFGTSHIFAKGCDPSPYSVTGTISEDEQEIVMYGIAPRLNPDCTLKGTRDDKLVFTYSPDADPDADAGD